MLLETLKQIEKELEYAETKHPHQSHTRVGTLDIAMAKLEEGYDAYKKYRSSCPEFCTCNDKNKWACSALATIAILIRGIEEEFEMSAGELFKERDKYLSGMLKEYEKVDLEEL